MTKPKTVDEYISGFPEDTQKILKQIRKTIKEVLPDAEETISYDIPTFKMNGTYVVYFAGYKNHIAIYPLPKSSKALSKALEPYKKGKGTAQFPLDKQIPLALITRMVKALKKENEERTKEKKKPR